MPRKKVEQKPKKLTDADLRLIDKNHFEQKEKDYEIVIIQEEIKTTQLKLEALLLKREVLNYKKANLLNKNKDLLREISLRLGLKNEQFGFDPITGEIKE